jgi:hypothetical protein
MRTTPSRLEIPPAASAGLARSQADLFDALTLIGFAGEELSRMALRRLARPAHVPRDRARLDRLARQTATLDQLAMLCREIAGLRVDAEPRIEESAVSRPPREEPRIPPPPVGRPESDLALAHLEAWWTSCVPVLIGSARTSAAAMAEGLHPTGSAACRELAEHLARFAAGEYDALLE